MGTHYNLFEIECVFYYTSYIKKKSKSKSKIFIEDLNMKAMQNDDEERLSDEEELLERE